MNTMRVDIVTPDGRLYQKNVKSVTLPGASGEFGVLPGHSSLVSLLQCGVIDIEEENGHRDSVLINWGYAKVDEMSVDILVDGAVAIKGENDSEIAKALSDCKALIKDMGDSSAMIASVETKVETIARSIL